MKQLHASPWARRLAFVASAALVALALHLTIRDPRAGLLILFTMGAFLGPRLWRQRRLQRAMRQADLGGILAAWRSKMHGVPHAETMGPLMMATAFAAHGRVDKARELLTQAVRGPAWEAAIEHRLFLDAMLFSFEGEGTQAQYAAARLSRLPLPVADAEMARQVVAMRLALGALARAFCREAERGDTEVMIAVGEASPLVLWPMRYGAAINHLDAGNPTEAQRLIREAPSWPEESRFHSLHEELRVEVNRQRAGDAPTSEDGVRTADDGVSSSGSMREE